MSGTRDVENALMARLFAPSPGASLPADEVARLNEQFEATGRARWYRPTFMPAEPVSSGIGTAAKNRHRGIFQVDLFYPLDGGRKSAQDEAERIVACYAVGTALAYNEATVLIERSYRGRGFTEDAWFHVPVVIRWRSDVAR